MAAEGGEVSVELGLVGEGNQQEWIRGVGAFEAELGGGGGGSEPLQGHMGVVR